MQFKTIINKMLNEDTDTYDMADMPLNYPGGKVEWYRRHVNTNNSNRVTTLKSKIVNAYRQICRKNSYLGNGNSLEAKLVKKYKKMYPDGRIDLNIFFKCFIAGITCGLFNNMKDMAKYDTAQMIRFSNNNIVVNTIESEILDYTEFAEYITGDTEAGSDIDYFLSMIEGIDLTAPNEILYHKLFEICEDSDFLTEFINYCKNELKMPAKNISKTLIITYLLYINRKILYNRFLNALTRPKLMYRGIVVRSNKNNHLSLVDRINVGRSWTWDYDIAKQFINYSKQPGAFILVAKNDPKNIDYIASAVLMGHYTGLYSIVINDNNKIAQGEKEIRILDEWKVDLVKIDDMSIT